VPGIEAHLPQRESLRAGWHRPPSFAVCDVLEGQVRAGSEEQVSGVRFQGGQSEILRFAQNDCGRTAPSVGTVILSAAKNLALSSCSGRCCEVLSLAHRGASLHQPDRRSSINIRQNRAVTRIESQNSFKHDKSLIVQPLGLSRKRNIIVTQNEYAPAMIRSVHLG